jgi:hypothetical protein
MKECGRMPTAATPPSVAVDQLESLGGIAHHNHKPNANQIMQPQNMAGIGGLFFVFVYLACVIGIIICLIRLLYRFVGAHERIASSLDIISRKMRDDCKP